MLFKTDNSTLECFYPIGHYVGTSVIVASVVIDIIAIIHFREFKADLIESIQEKKEQIFQQFEYFYTRGLTEQGKRIWDYFFG